MEKKPSRKIVPAKDGNILRELVMRIKLIMRLMGDRRINPFLKLLPLASLVYLVWPIDLAPGIALPVIGAVDDAAILWLGTYLFVELCPPGIVREHAALLMSNNEILDGIHPDDEVVDAETTEIDE